MGGSPDAQQVEVWPLRRAVPTVPPTLLPRLRNCDREPADDALMIGPAAARILSRTVALSPARSMSTVMVTAVSDVFACWPPGPPERVATHETASAAISSPRGVLYMPFTGSTDPLLSVRPNNAEHNRCSRSPRYGSGPRTALASGL